MLQCCDIGLFGYKLRPRIQIQIVAWIWYAVCCRAGLAAQIVCVCWNRRSWYGRLRAHACHLRRLEWLDVAS